ncbi:MAG: hypothetical protein Q8O10_09985 [candidate division Zixibacteria bacterium]|nr:hypothetical protein [candidate division Zixibacteria bacterium]
MVLPALRRGGYQFEPQVVIGRRPGGGTHKIDVVATKGTRSLLISLKWQQVHGTAEQKVPFEIICLMRAIDESEEYEKAYLVLGGDGWTLRDFYLSGDLHEFLDYDPQVEILSLERFVARANASQL